MEISLELNEIQFFVSINNFFPTDMNLHQVRCMKSKSIGGSKASNKKIHAGEITGPNPRYLSPSFWGVEPEAVRDYFMSRSDNKLPNLPDAALKLKSRYLN